MNIQMITAAVIMFLLVVVYPIKGFHEFAKLKKQQIVKLKHYREIIWGTLIPALIIIISIPFSGMHFHEIGLKAINIRTSHLSNWIIYPTVVLYFLYLIYNIYSIIVLKFNKESRVKAAIRIPNELRTFFPVTQKERILWDFVSLNAGVTEELIYRGYLFYIIATILPGLRLPITLILSTIIFGIGHIYQGLEAIKSIILGLLFGFLYIVFDSILPLMIIHYIQDSVVRDLLQDELLVQKVS